MSFIKGTFTYLKSFLQDRDVASVTPSSKYCVEKLCSHIDFSNTKYLVEYGPGTGIFTKTLLDRLPKDSRLFAFETNDLFVEELSNIDDERFVLFHDSVEHLPELLPEEVMGNVDHVISGIPFSFFNWELKIKIMSQTMNSLSETGSFLAYQTPGHMKEPLLEVFKNVETDLCWRNIPPYYIYESFKKVG
jgi:phospholipid N-methyltransferase